MQQISSREEVEDLRQRAKSVLPDWDLVPDAHAVFAYAYHTDAGACVDRRFFHLLKLLCLTHSCHDFCFIVLAPDPVSYYAKHFHWFPAFRFSTQDDDGDYMKALAADPGGSPADAIFSRADRIAIFPPALDWFIAADREADLAWIWTKRPIQDRPSFPSFWNDTEWKRAKCDAGRT